MIIVPILLAQTSVTVNFKNYSAYIYCY